MDGDARNSNSHILSLLYSPYSYEIPLMRRTEFMYSTRSLWQRVVLPKLVCLLAVFLLALTSAAGAQTSLRLDADKDKPQPRNWRLMTDAWHREFSGAAPSREGMDKLNISASALASVPGYQWIWSHIKSAAPAVTNVYIVDLKQESHGYANDAPVSLVVGDKIKHPRGLKFQH